MEKLELKFNKLTQKISELTLDEKDLEYMSGIVNIKLFGGRSNSVRVVKIILTVTLISFFAYQVSKIFSSDSKCLVRFPDTLSRTFRPLQSCDFCKHVAKIDSIYNISPDVFEELYAYNGHPVIVKDATANWTALHKFSFNFFKDLYLNANSSKTSCQFFPYKTEFKSLQEALRMGDERAVYKVGKPWYFGWSNCDHEVGEELRRHYSRPYFLPKYSENNDVDWIFMGVTGYGAHMHVDNVRLPSWQAQIHGSKEWTLAPPTECYYKCKWFKIVVQKGDTSKLNILNVILFKIFNFISYF